MGQVPERNRREVFFMYLSAFTIGLPFTVVGLLVWLFISLFYKKNYSVIFVEGRIGIILWDTRFGGVSLGIVYLVDGNNSNEIHCHELGHTVQFKWLGVLFLVVIAIPSIIRYNVRRLIFVQKHFKLRAYDAVWFEGQASSIGMNTFYDHVIHAKKEQI